MYIVGGIRGSNVAQVETWYSLRRGKIWKTKDGRMRAVGYHLLLQFRINMENDKCVVIIVGSGEF